MIASLVCSVTAGPACVLIRVPKWGISCIIAQRFLHMSLLVYYWWMNYSRYSCEPLILILFLLLLFFFFNEVFCCSDIFLVIIISYNQIMQLALCNTGHAPESSQCRRNKDSYRKTAKAVLGRYISYLLAWILFPDPYQTQAEQRFLCHELGRLPFPVL